ncbi:Major facilitator superfamily protein [Spironucleus salmonicida]|uniref:Major facilitator superfamily protein n=1 Tax=Spironucleus salmonicida TaxID=348837 RepID=V6LVM1_9EUKA|nr:Major facilitator superfamily protein [Spironucleus salmonicida]|eukprot:EST47741.1 Major facilitator superfamily protein [Spironucleus salmonicida]
MVRISYRERRRKRTLSYFERMQQSKEYIHPIFNPWNYTPVKSKGTPVLLAALLASFPQFLYQLTNTSIYSFTSTFAAYFKVEIVTIQIIQHSENIVFCIVGFLSNKLHARLSIPGCYILGSFLIGVSSMLIFFSTSLYLLIFFRIFASFGCSIMQTATTPMLNFMVKEGKLERGMAAHDIIQQFASIIAMIGGGFLASEHPMFLFGISGALGIAHSILMGFFMPRFKINKGAKINLISFFLASFGILFTIVGAAFIAIGIGSLWLQIVFFVSGLILLVGFFVYDVQYALNHHIYPAEIFSPNAVRFLSCIFLLVMAQQSVSWFQPLIWRLDFGFSSQVSGILQSIVEITTALLYFMFPFIIIKLTNRLVMQIFSIIHIVIFTIGIVFLLKFNNIYSIECFYALSNISFVQMQLCIQIYNTYSMDRKYAFITGSLVALASKLAWSLGTALFTTVQRYTGYDLDLVCAICGGISIFFMICCFFVASFLDVFKWEMGRIGYKFQIQHEDSFEDDEVMQDIMNAVNRLKNRSLTFVLKDKGSLVHALAGIESQIQSSEEVGETTCLSSEIKSKYEIMDVSIISMTSSDLQ